MVKAMARKNGDDEGVLFEMALEALSHYPCLVVYSICGISAGKSNLLDDWVIIFSLNEHVYDKP